jgi:hypothetical protein
LPMSCCLWYSACLERSPVTPATALPKAPVARSDSPEPKSFSCPRASCSWPSRFCSRPLCFRFSDPTSPPTVSLADPTVWFHEPVVRSGSSLVMAPADDAVKPGTFAVACEASYSASPLFCLAAPSACGALC